MTSCFRQRKKLLGGRNLLINEVSTVIITTLLLIYDMCIMKINTHTRAATKVQLPETCACNNLHAIFGITLGTNLRYTQQFLLT